MEIFSPSQFLELDLSQFKLDFSFPASAPGHCPETGRGSGVQRKGKQTESCPGSLHDTAASRGRRSQ